jgi:sorbitol-6-phosphate 2-dehydrogenase
MNKSDIAALVRGLCIDKAGTAQTLVFEREGAVPAAALRLELDAGDTAADVACAVQNAYGAWSRAAAGECGDAVLVPSCAAITLNGKAEGLFWIDSDYDSAKGRLLERNASPVLARPRQEGALVAVAERAGVVRGRIALVTGGAQGIGEEIVRNLAAGGALVFIADLNLEGAQKLAAAVNAAEKRTAALAAQVNVADEVSVERLFNHIAETSGGLDLCVSNAGVLKAGSVLEQNLADFQFVTDINYTGFFLTSKYAGRLLAGQHLTAPCWKTDIIQINSKSGLEGSNRNGAYAGGKFGGIGLVASFALELIDYNIKVNAICPGNFLDGPLWSHPEKGLFVQYLHAGKVPGAKTIADVRAFYESKVPMKRGCTGKDLARAIFYIVEQEYETGQAVPVTGGQVMLH